MNVVLWFSVVVIHCVVAKISDDYNGGWTVWNQDTDNNSTSEEVYTVTNTKYLSDENTLSNDETTLTRDTRAIADDSERSSVNIFSTRVRENSKYENVLNSPKYNNTVNKVYTNTKYSSEGNSISTDETSLANPLISTTDPSDIPTSDRSSDNRLSTRARENYDKHNSEDENWVKYLYPITNTKSPSEENSISTHETRPINKYDENSLSTKETILTVPSISTTNSKSTATSDAKTSDISSSTTNDYKDNYVPEVDQTADSTETLGEYATGNSISTTLDFSTESTSSPITDDVSTQSSDLAGSTVTMENEDPMRENQTRIAAACPELPPVSFSSITPSSFEVTLQWEDPENKECVTQFIINIDEDSYTSPVDSNELNISDLLACHEYNVSIMVSNGTANGPRAEDAFNTTAPNSFNYTVQDLEVMKAPDNMLKITWEPPENANILECITSYYVVWWDADDNSDTTNTDVPASNTSLETPTVGCMKYRIMVYPKAGENLSGQEQYQNYTAEELPTAAPEVIPTIVTGKDHANMTWKTDDRSKNKCQLEKIVVTCNAPTDENSNYPWIVRNMASVKDITTTTVDYRFPMSIENLSPFTNYSCLGLVENIAGNSSTTPFKFFTKEDVPSSPREVKVTHVGPYEFTIEWTEPDKIPGVMTKYGVSIENGGPMQFPTKECADNVTNHFEEVNAQQTSYTFTEAIPYHKYIVSVYGTDGAGDGSRGTTNTTTLSTAPDAVENAQMGTPNYSQDETYHAVVTLNFDPPCNTNGPLKYYGISYIGKRNGFGDHTDFIQTSKTETDIELQPDRDYSINIIVVAEQFNSTPMELSPLHSQPGVPILDVNLTSPTPVETTKAKFQLAKDAFNDTNGEIVSYALFLLLPKSGIENSTYGFWNGNVEMWPSIPNAQLLTPKPWNPFAGGETTANFIIGENDSCKDESYCNKKLDEDTEYVLIVRALTTAAYKDSSPLHFKTDMLGPSQQLALILGLTFGLLALLILTIFLIFLWRRKNKATIQEEKRYSASTPEAVPCQKFVSYYGNVKENFNIIKEQFTNIGTRSKEAATPITYATLAENRRKNRYTNILPFDATRVKLKIDEDDEISSDYINASYIKGYSGKIEYIATQGPLESTSRDFWKMILQENVSIIVMVSQFVEQSKEKCYQYFPNNHESAYFGESLEVKCSTELHFGTYCIRTLQIRKGEEQRNVIHMQFLEWPDFGVPQGTDNMLQFCRQLREKTMIEGGVIVVHCSAGVGRTGTLIALDILLQTIDDRRDINIYKTVFDLRKQRTHMVQTEKQYVFIHTCVKEYIETPTILSNESGPDRIYENMDVLKSSLKKNLIETELESAL